MAFHLRVVSRSLVFGNECLGFGMQFSFRRLSVPNPSLQPM